jgi:quercetin dioxygenase-like cupin family protein
MAILHALSGQAIDIHPVSDDLQGARTVALFKTDELEVIRLVLAAGKVFPPHRVAGEVTIQCIRGKIEITCDGSAQVLRSGQLMYLSGGVQHSVLALEDACALLTVVLRK